MLNQYFSYKLLQRRGTLLQLLRGNNDSETQCAQQEGNKIDIGLSTYTSFSCLIKCTLFPMQKANSGIQNYNGPSCLIAGFQGSCLLGN